MRYRTLGRTGMSVSEVSLGGAYLKGPDPERYQENAAAVVRRAAELGINYLDTAPGYGPSEELLGPALERAGRPFLVATKVGFVPEDIDFRRDSVVASLEASLRKLRIDRLAVAQIHEVNLVGWERIMEPGGALDGLRAARDAGLCEAIGITGRAIPLLARLAETGEFDTVLVYHDYHPACQKAREEVIPAAAKQDMGIVVGTPLGALFGHEAKRRQTLAALSDRERGSAERVIEGLRREPGTLARNAFRYIMADKAVSTVSSGAADVEQLEDVAEASAMGAMPAELVAELERMGADG